MKKYICKKELTLSNCDPDGFCTEECTTITPGEAFEEEPGNLMIAAPLAIRLVASDLCWIEISPETLEEYFEEIQ